MQSLADLKRAYKMYLKIKENKIKDLLTLIKKIIIFHGIMHIFIVICIIYVDINYLLKFKLDSSSRSNLDLI